MARASTPIRARHVHNAGRTVETRPPTAAEQYASAAPGSDVHEINLIY